MGGEGQSPVLLWGCDVREPIGTSHSIHSISSAAHTHAATQYDVLTGTKWRPMASSGSVTSF